jgi:type VI secretion system protein ImpI/type VI secretion system protein
VTLKLVTIRCPDDVAPERREVRGGEFSIGRGNDNQWIVMDPDRHLSKKHCQFLYVSGGWELHDHSTNGTFLNDADDPIGRGASHALRSGDRVKFGLYEVEVTIEEVAAGGFPSYESDIGLRDPVPSRREVPPYRNEGLRDSASMSDAQSPLLPADFDPLAPGSDPFTGPSESDHAPALQSAFSPPRPVSIIPEDWDVDLSAGAPRASVPADLPIGPPARAPSAQAPSARAAAEASAPAVVPHEARQPVPDAAPAPRSADGSAEMSAFRRGVGLDDAAFEEPEKMMEHLGTAVRATVSGLRHILMARASIKDEFRIEQTMIRPTGNNPLKFSLDDDDALATLLGIGRRGSMPAEEAIAEAFEDLRLHELATISAMQEAVRVLLAQFDPGTIERNAGSGGLQIHPAQKKARAWDAFTQQHKKVTQALSDDFDSVFGKAFARAYEQAIEKLSAERGTS